MSWSCAWWFGSSGCSSCLLQTKPQTQAPHIPPNACCPMMAAAPILL
uniref:Uncharacterized protein n=1 Tax=Setaria viridis TaxID=4556 RepID=A0A4U6VJT0_SETVI|nr:hypothetical protein SEVIR_3G379950v2 [Setaria viridis]